MGAKHFGNPQKRVKPGVATLTAERRDAWASAPGVLLAFSNMLLGFFALMMTVTVAIALCFGGVFLIRSGGWSIAAGAALLLWGLVVEVPLILALLLATARSGSIAKPVILAMAERQRRWPMVVRQIVGVWWLMHTLFIAQFPLAFAAGPANAAWGMKLWLGFMATILCALSFGFVVLAWACFDNHQVRLERLWNFRWWWVAIVALGCFFVALFQRLIH